MSNKGVLIDLIFYNLPKEKSKAHALPRVFNISENRIREHENRSVSKASRRPKLKSF